MPKNSNAPRSQEDYITQIGKEIEGRVTKKLSQVFSRTDNRILGALARLDDFLMKLLIQGNSEAAPETSRNAFSSNQGTKADDSQSDLHAEASIFNNQTTGIVGAEEGQEMVTEVTLEVRNRYYLVTGVDEEVTYCSPSILQESRKRTALPLNHNSLVRITLRWLKQTKFCWPNNNNSANFPNNKNRISKLPKSLTTTIPTF